MRLLYKNYLYEAIAKGQDLYLEPGTTLFHGTGEEIEGGLGTGGYDGILWTSKSSNIAQSYIPVSGITSRMDSQAFTKPSERLAPFQKQIGIEFDADYDAYGKATSFAIISPPIFKDADDSKRQALRHLMDVEKSTKAIKEQMQAKYKNSGFVFTPEQEAELDADVKKEDQALADLKAAEEAYRNANAQLIKNQYVNEKLKELGYEPLEKGHDENYQWKLKESENQILPGDYRRKGQLYIIKPKRKMKLYDMAMGNEPDLTERQYHELDTFEWAKENGYDGVKINDFAQTETYGNMGHTSYGFFKDAIKDLDITSINDVVHPKEMNGPHSDEYRKHAGINEAVQNMPSATDDEDDNVEGFFGKRGAGCLFLALNSGNVLIGKRSEKVMEPGTWGTWGGKMEDGEDPVEALQREMQEEAGFNRNANYIGVYVFKEGEFKYYNYLVTVPQEFQPTLNDETDDFEWASIDNLPQPLHFGLEEALPYYKSAIRKAMNA